MLGARGRFIVAALLFCAVFCQIAAFAEPAADTPRLGDRLRQQFPIAAEAVGIAGALPSNPKAVVANARGGASGAFGEPIALDNGRERVLVRPLASHATAARTERFGTAFHGGFRGIDVLRTGGREVLVIADAKALAGIRYEASDVSSRTFAVLDGRMVRFVPLVGRGPVDGQLAISAPYLVDANGRVSANARWEIGAGRDANSWVLSLRVDDKGLRYPLAAFFAPGSMADARAAAAKTVAATGKTPRMAVNGTGVIAGQVTDAVTGGGIEGEAVTLFTGTGDYVDTAITATGGFYNFFNLDTGSYRAFASATGYPSELYNEIPCPDGCDPLNGTAFTVTDGQTTSNIDFTLGSELTRIAGFVMDDTFAPLVDMTIVAYDATGNAIGAAVTDANGSYQFVLRGGGTYYVRTFNSAYEGVVDQVYDGIDCTGCDPTDGTPVSLATGDTRSDVDFELHRNGGRIAGSVTETSTGRGLTDATLTVFNADGVEVTNAYGNADGDYLTFHGLAAGSYYVLASVPDYRQELYNEIDCSGRTCVITDGDPVAVTLGATASGVDFTLGDAVVRASGRVYDGETDVPIRDIYVLYFNESGEYVSGAVTGDDGSYEVLLPGDGTYFALTRNFYHPDYIDELYDNIPCSNCDPTTGTEIEASTASPAQDIDFALDTDGFTIAGRVVDGGNQPIVNAFVQIYSDAGNPVAYGYSDANGDWVSFQHVSPGTYYAVGYATGYESQLYNGQSCSNGCDPVTGTAIAVTAANVTGINFQLSAEGCPDIDIQPATLPNTVPGGSYSETLVATGGASPYTFVLADGELPPGLTLSSAGVISGTPTNAGNYNFLVSATDANGCVGSRGYAIVVQGTATTTALTVAPSNSVLFGQSFTLTATVDPSNATGVIAFSSNTELFGFVAVNSSGQASITVSLAVGEHDLFAEYAGDATYSGSTSAAVHVFVTKATPVITWPTPAAITYPEAISATQLNATANVPGTFTYTPVEGTVLDAGTHTLSVHFVPEDGGTYNDADATVQLVVNKANQTITWATPDPIVYGTPLSDTQLNATVTVPGPSPAGELTYNPAAGAVLNAGTNTLSVTAAATTNYNAATATVELVVLKVTPVFSDLSAPTIIIGTASTTISGKIAADALIPPGNVVITLNGTSQNAAIGADGSFSASFATGALGTAIYPVTFAYAGSQNFHPANASSTLTVTYGVSGEPIPNQPKGSNGTIPVSVKLLNASGQNVSTANLTLTPVGLRLVGDPDFTPVVTLSPTFRYQNAQGGRYVINIRPNNLPAGTYEFGFTVGGDPVTHTITFVVQ